MGHLVPFSAAQHGFEKPWCFDHLPLASRHLSISNLDIDTPVAFHPGQVMNSDGLGPVHFDTSEKPM
jgi:hypothetical protein